LLKFAFDHGVDVYAALNTIHEILDLPPYVPKHSTRRGVGINGLIDDILAILPVDALKTLYDYKVQNSPDFKELDDAIHGPEFAVSIHCFYLSQVSCCLWYVHTCV
jgi:hypothetical protein